MPQVKSLSSCCACKCTGACTSNTLLKVAELTLDRFCLDFSLLGLKWSCRSCPWNCMEILAAADCSLLGPGCRRESKAGGERAGGFGQKMDYIFHWNFKLFLPSLLSEAGKIRWMLKLKSWSVQLKISASDPPVCFFFCVCVLQRTLLKPEIQL